MKAVSLSKTTAVSGDARRSPGAASGYQRTDVTEIGCKHRQMALNIDTAERNGTGAEWFESGIAASYSAIGIILISFRSKMVSGFSAWRGSARRTSQGNLSVRRQG
jgi:hypothetical protein